METAPQQNILEAIDQFNLDRGKELLNLIDRERLVALKGKVKRQTLRDEYEQLASAIPAANFYNLGPDTMPNHKKRTLSSKMRNYNLINQETQTADICVVCGALDSSLDQSISYYGLSLTAPDHSLYPEDRLMRCYMPGDFSKYERKMLLLDGAVRTVEALSKEDPSSYRRQNSFDAVMHKHLQYLSTILNFIDQEPLIDEYDSTSFFGSFWHVERPRMLQRLRYRFSI